MKDSWSRLMEFIPPDTCAADEASMTRQGLSLEFARFLLNTKCLWLVRMSTVQIAKLHIADLRGRYNVVDRHPPLDVIELAAVYYALPSEFLSDPGGEKETWASFIEILLLEKLLNDKDAGIRNVNQIYLPELPQFHSYKNHEDQINCNLKHEKYQPYDSSNVRKLPASALSMFEGKNMKFKLAAK